MLWSSFFQITNLEIRPRGENLEIAFKKLFFENGLPFICGIRGESELAMRLWIDLTIAIIMYSSKGTALELGKLTKLNPLVILLINR